MVIRKKRSMHLWSLSAPCTEDRKGDIVHQKMYCGRTLKDGVGWKVCDKHMPWAVSNSKWDFAF